MQKERESDKETVIYLGSGERESVCVCVEVSTEARMGTLAPFSHLVRRGKVFLTPSNLTKVLKLFFMREKKLRMVFMFPPHKNIRPEWKWHSNQTTLAYYVSVLTTAREY